MKNITVLLIIMFITFNLFGQPQVGDNTIIVKKDVDINFLMKILVKNGYGISEVDKDNGILTTKDKPLEGSVYASDLTVSITLITDSATVYMFGNYKFSSLQYNYNGRATYEKRKLIGTRLAFDELELLAKEIGTEIQYKKE